MKVENRLVTLGSSDAAKAFQLALSIYTLTKFPLENIISGYNLGKVAFAAQLWTEAIQGFADAIEAVETSPGWVASKEQQKFVLKYPIDEMYEKIVTSCINGGRLKEALIYVKRSSSKQLMDLIATKNAQR